MMSQTILPSCAAGCRTSVRALPASHAVPPTRTQLTSLTSMFSVPALPSKPIAQLRQRAARGTRLRVSAAQQQEEEKEEKEVNFVASKAAQLLGIRGAGDTADKWKIRLQLTKPVTWVPLIWGVLCGAAASGQSAWMLGVLGSETGVLGVLCGAAASGQFTWTPEHVAQSLACMTMSGPLLTGYTQTINDYYDRELDAINEPYRPIPSGAISEPEVIVQFLALLAGGLGVAYGLDKWVGHGSPTLFYLAVFGSFISYIYSAPPLKLKQSGWAGNYALGASYIALPWLAGQALFGELRWDVTILVVLYSLAGLGIAIVNDFKSIEGDRDLGMQSLPVAFGVDTAKYICCGTIDITQLAVAAYLFAGLGEKTYAAVLFALVLPQIFLQLKYFLPDPIKNDVKYQASAQPFLVFGLLTTGLAVGHHTNSLLQ